MYKVLVVEDEASLRRGLIRFIPWEEYGCTICGEAQSGVEGLARIRELRPDIVFTDLKMPSMGGLEMLRLSKEEFTYEAVVISGYGEFDYARQAMAVGTADFLLKPLERQELIRVVQKLVDRLDRARDTGAPPPPQALADLGEESSRYTREAAAYIARHYQEKLSVGGIARQLQLSADHLNRIFKKDMGVTVHDYLTSFRIRKACGLLRQGPGIKVYEVADLVGFGEYKYFHRVFTKEMGVSPSEYKKQKGSAHGGK